MKINNYIIRGGENLNSAAKKTVSFPIDAEQIFNDWHSKLGKDDNEKENYFETPVNDQSRLFIRAFYEEKAGNRPICFYVGLLIPREMYKETKDYYSLHRGLCSVSLDQIHDAAMSSLRPIEVTTDWPIPRTPIGMDFQQLSKMRLYGEKEFSANINQMCFAISINNIDDWFDRLFIAVNPYRLSQAYNIVVSREQPRPAMHDDKPFKRPRIQKPSPWDCCEKQDPISDPKDSKNQGSPDSYVNEKSDPPNIAPISTKTDFPKTEPFSPNPGTDNLPIKHSPRKIHWLFYIILVVALIISLYHIAFCGGRVPLKDYYRLQDENKSLRATNKELSEQCSAFAKDNAKIEREMHRLDQKIKTLEQEKKELETELLRYKRKNSEPSLFEQGKTLLKK